MYKEYNSFTENESAKSRKGLIVLISCAVLALAVIVFVIAVISKVNSSKKFMNFAKMESVTAVRTVVAEKQTLNDYVLTNGEVETQKSIDVFPSMGGKVVEMRVSLGSQVKAGDIIAYVDPSEPGSYYAKSPVTAPISGSILTAPVKTGQKVSMSSVITKIGDINNLQVTAKIPERYVSVLKIGQQAEVSVQAYPDEKFIASVVRISPVVDASTRTKEIILNFDKHYSQITAGMYANVKLYTVDYADYPAIQQDAFVVFNDDYYLYVVKEDSTVEKRLVQRGKNVNGYYQVLSGINEGETVVVDGMLTLFEGAKVNDVDKPQKNLESDNSEVKKPENKPDEKKAKDKKSKEKK